MLISIRRSMWRLPGLMCAASMCTLSTLAMAQELRWPLKDANATDLASAAYGRNRTTGQVSDYLRPDTIAHIVILRANSNATPDIWVRSVRNAIEHGGAFVAPASADEQMTPWLEAVIVSKDGRYFSLQLDASLARLIGDDVRGYFAYR